MSSVDCIIALDLSLSCTGWCVARRDAPPVYGAIFPVAAKDHPGGRIASLHEGLTALFLDHPDIGETWYELPLPPGSRGQFAAIASWACDTVVKMVAFQRNAPIISAHMGKIRKHVLGRGSFGDRASNKGAALQWCRDLGIMITNDNIADAICVAEFGANANAFSAFVGR